MNREWEQVRVNASQLLTLTNPPQPDQRLEHLFHTLPWSDQTDQGASEAPMDRIRLEVKISHYLLARRMRAGRRHVHVFSSIMGHNIKRPT